MWVFQKNNHPTHVFSPSPAIWTISEIPKAFLRHVQASSLPKAIGAEGELRRFMIMTGGPLTYQEGLIKGNQWLISPDVKFTPFMLGKNKTCSTKLWFDDDLHGIIRYNP